MFLLFDVKYNPKIATTIPKNDTARSSLREYSVSVGTNVPSSITPTVMTAPTINLLGLVVKILVYTMSRHNMRPSGNSETTRTKFCNATK